MAKKKKNIVNKEEKIKEEVKEETLEKDLEIVDEEVEVSFDDEDYDDEDELVQEIDLAEVGNDDVRNVEFDINKEIKSIKFLICISICISVISLFVGLFVLSKLSDGDNSSKSDESEEVTESSEYDISMFKAITMDDFKEMFKEDKTYVVFTGRSTCGYCVAFLPHAQKSVEKYDYTLYYLDVDTITKDDVEDAIELDSSLEDTFSNTPMVYVIDNGEVVDVNEGYTDYDVFAGFLEDNGIDKK